MSRPDLDLPLAGERLIGDAAKNQATTNPARTVYDVKRLIGRKCAPRPVTIAGAATISGSRQKCLHLICNSYTATVRSWSCRTSATDCYGLHMWSAVCSTVYRSFC